MTREEAYETVAKLAAEHALIAQAYGGVIVIAHPATQRSSATGCYCLEKAMKKWEPWFAWFPVQLTTGKIAWLRKVKRRWNNDLNPWGDISGHSGTDGGWEYK